MAGRPRKIVDDVDLFRWYSKNRGKSSMEMCDDTGRRAFKNFDGSLAERRATIWCLHQFDPVIIWEAMTGKPVSAKRLYHQPDSWDLYRIIRKQIEMLEDDTEIVKGAPRVSTATKLAITDRLREFHRIAASAHKEFLLSTLRPRTERDGPDVPESNEDEDVVDPIILKMNREAAS